MTSSTFFKIAENIKRYRISKHLTQEKLSEKAGISTDYISLIERGKRTPSLKRLYEIAEVLGIEPFLLLK